MMPRLSGLEACRLLKGMTNESFLPVVLVTVKTDTASRVEGSRSAPTTTCASRSRKKSSSRASRPCCASSACTTTSASARQKLERLSVHDELTGLYNYRYLHTRLTEEFKRAERYHEPFACVFVDIDQLKAHNDAGRAPARRRIIRSVADAIRKCVREVDVVARYGGEEFLVVLPSTHFAGSVTVAERIWREVTEKRFTVDSVEVPHGRRSPSASASIPRATCAPRTRSSAPPTARCNRPSARAATASASSSSRATSTRRRSAPSRSRAYRRPAGATPAGSAMTSASFRPPAAHPDHAASRHHRSRADPARAARKSDADARALGR